MGKMKILGLEIEDSPPYQEVTGHLVAILLLLILGFTAGNYLYNGIIRPVFTEKIDFEAYYNGALAFRYKFPLYQTMVDFFKVGPYAYEGPLPYVYPPFFAIFLSPLAYLSFNTAVFVWFFINQILFFSGIYLLLRTMSRKYSSIEIAVLLFVFMNFTPLFVDYLIGQCNVILFFLITAGLYCYRSDKPVYAGIAMALACVIKVIPVLLLFYALWKRQFKVFLAGMLTLLSIFSYSLLFFDVKLFPWYLKFMMHQTLFNAFHDNHSITGFFSRLLTHSMWIKGLFDSPTAARLCIALTSLVVIGVFLVVTRKKTKVSDSETPREYALGVVTMLLLSKMTSTPYLVMLLLPLGVMAKDMLDKKVGGKWLICLPLVYAALTAWYPLSVGKFLEMDYYTLFLEGFQANLFFNPVFRRCRTLVLFCFWKHGS